MASGYTSLAYMEEYLASQHALASGPVRPKPVNLFHTPFHPDDHRRQRHAVGAAGGAREQNRVVAFRVRPGSGPTSAAPAGASGYQDQYGYGAGLQGMSADAGMPSEYAGIRRPEPVLVIEPQPTKDPLLGAQDQLSRKELRSLQIAGRHLTAQAAAAKGVESRIMEEARAGHRLPMSVILDPKLAQMDNRRVASPYANNMLPGRALHVVRPGQRRRTFDFDQEGNALAIVGLGRGKAEKSPNNQTAADHGAAAAASRYAPEYVMPSDLPSTLSNSPDASSGMHAFVEDEQASHEYSRFHEEGIPQPSGNSGSYPAQQRGAPQDMPRLHY